MGNSIRAVPGGGTRCGPPPCPNPTSRRFDCKAEIVELSEFVIGSGEILTKVTIWITIAGYAAGAAAFALSRERYKWDSAARLAWTVACVGLLAHVAFAFHFYHGWSHGAAYRDTARQTDEVVGLNWGGGLYVNYALLIVLGPGCRLVVAARARSLPPSAMAAGGGVAWVLDFHHLQRHRRF